VRHRGRFCYVSALLPGYREPAPILRLRYQGSADRWAIGIYLASSDRYTESELPTSFGPKTGTPEEGVDDTFILYAGPKTGRLRPSARTRPRPQKCQTRVMFERAKTVSIAPRMATVVSATGLVGCHALTGRKTLDASEIPAVGRYG
jgi:hypothetical protein